jgi:hypothetical protein
MKLRTITRNTRGLNRGWRGPRDRREGYKQRAVRRLLIAANGQPVTTVQIMEAIYLRGEPWTDWRWDWARRSASRYAVRVLKPRSRPLLWRGKPNLLFPQQLAKDDETP